MTYAIKQGDCLELMKDIDSKSIDMILTDLPYGVTDCEWDNVISFSALWNEYNRVIKDRGAIVLFSIQPFTTKLIASNLKHFKYCWYWKKNNVTGALICKYQPMRCIEDICVFYKQAPKYNPQGIIKLDKPKINKADKSSKIYQGKRNDSLQQFTNYPKNLLEFNREPNYYHPTQKPVALLEYLINTYTDKGAIILDSCMGSGSTGVASINCEREFIGIEKEVNFFDIAKKRIEAAERERGIA